MPLSAFMPGPTYEANTPADVVQNAFEQPFSASGTFGQGVIGGALSSYGLGTTIRDTNTSPGRQQVNDQGNIPAIYTSQTDTHLETDQDLAQRGDQGLTQDQYKQSQFYRPEIPYDPSMTVNRARDLSQFADAQAVRNAMAARRPWTALAGNFAGSALDPINYVPVLGEEASAAAIARLGVVGGRALVGSADAALNVGTAGLLTAPVRQSFGDDISWQAQASQIAMGAALGASFGAVHGIFSARADARDAARMASIQDGLSTIRNGQDSMATISDAVAGLAHDGTVNLGEGSLDRLDGLSSQMVDAAQGLRDDGTVPETPADYATRVLGEQFPEDTQRLSELDTAIQGNTDELASLRSESMDNERFGPTRAAFIEAQQLDTKYQRLSDAADKANSDVQQAKLQKQGADVQTQVQALFDKLDPATVDRLDQLEQTIPLREKTLADAQAAREPIAAKLDAARQDIQAKYLSEPLPADAQRVAASGARDSQGRATAPADAAPDVPTIQETKGIAASRSPREIVSTKAAPEVTTPEAKRAAADVAKPDTPSKIAEANGVNAETGEFKEQAYLDQLDKEGRMSEQDHEEMSTANDNFETAKSWGEVLKAAVACLI